MGSKNTCSVCAAPPEVLGSINRALANGAKLREIALESGLSKSAIHRHGKNCLDRIALRTFRNQKTLAAHNSRFITVWPSGEMCLQADPKDLRGTLSGKQISLAELREGDIMFQIEFEQNGPLKNPRRDLADVVNSGTPKITS